jgi:hypothetical protein
MIHQGFSAEKQGLFATLLMILFFIQELCV